MSYPKNIVQNCTLAGFSQHVYIGEKPQDMATLSAIHISEETDRAKAGDLALQSAIFCSPVLVSVRGATILGGEAQKEYLHYMSLTPWGKVKHSLWALFTGAA